MVAVAQIFSTRVVGAVFEVGSTGRNAMTMNAFTVIIIGDNGPITTCAGERYRETLLEASLAHTLRKCCALSRYAQSVLADSCSCHGLGCRTGHV